MLTLGVDLSTDPRKTGVCLVEWPDDGDQKATISHLRGSATDDDIVALAADVEVIGIDAPFGWPREWAASVAAYSPGKPFIASGTPAKLTLRATDHWVWANVRIRPLSVAANLIGATAIRCARLVELLGMTVDVGESRNTPVVSEVYPAAALKRWGLRGRLYKGRQGIQGRSDLIDALVEADLPIEFASDIRQTLQSSDDALDALLCSLVARAVALGKTDDAPEESREVARSEGWIRVPSIGTGLGALIA